MIDIRCTCGKTYHAEESHIGKSLRCTECGTILRIVRESALSRSSKGSEHVTLQDWLNEPAPSPVANVNMGGRRRDRWIGVGIAALGIVLLSVWLWLRQTGPGPTPTASNDSERIPLNKPPPAKPVPQYDLPHNLKPIAHPPIKPIPLETEDSKAVLIEPSCVDGKSTERPVTGERIEPDAGKSGESILKVTNGNNVDAAVRLVDISTKITSRFVYIRANEAYTMEGIEPGTYSLRYATGLDWVAACVEFQRDEEIHEDPKPTKFSQSVIDNSEYYEKTRRRVATTLHSVPFGNSPRIKIDRKRFLEGDQHFQNLSAP